MGAVTLLDDLADNRGDTASFEAARTIPFSSAPTTGTPDGVDETYLDFVQKVWLLVDQKLQQAPRFAEFEELFYFDLRQAINAMDYGRLMNERPTLVNVAGSETYGPHNMVMFGYADIDLMHSTAFDEADLSVLREVLWDVQRLARIGNWVSTWERELKEQDFTSGVVVRAVSNGQFQPTELGQDIEDMTELIDQINAAGIEEQLFDEWDDLFTQLRSQEYETESLDVEALIEGLETIRALHLRSKGLK